MLKDDPGLVLQTCFWLQTVPRPVLHIYYTILWFSSVVCGYKIMRSSLLHYYSLYHKDFRVFRVTGDRPLLHRDIGFISRSVAVRRSNAPSPVTRIPER